MCFLGREHTSPGRCFPCASQAGGCFLGRERHITRDMCFPGRGAHITRDMCFPRGGTHITRNMCFPGGGTHITRDMCFLGREQILIGMTVFPM